MDQGLEADQSGQSNYSSKHNKRFVSREKKKDTLSIIDIPVAIPTRETPTPSKKLAPAGFSLIHLTSVSTENSQQVRNPARDHHQLNPNTQGKGKSKTELRAHKEITVLFSNFI